MSGGTPYDVAVIGLGAMGSAAAWQLAKRGLRVLGLEQFAPGHDRGSSHGRSRVIRQAYFEHPDYVPLVRRAWELWRSLEAETGRALFRKTGVLLIGPPDCVIVRGSLDTARTHGVKHRMLSNQELRRSYPFMRFRPGDVALCEEEAGLLFAEDCVLAFQDRARELGAELRFGVKAAWDGEGLAPRVVLTVGPWMGAMLPRIPLRVERQVMYWFDPVSDGDRIPLFLWDVAGRCLYALPDVRGDGVKVGLHHGGESADPDRIRREVDREEQEDLRRLIAQTIPVLDGRLRQVSVCMYTNTPDEHFAIGLLPDRPQVAVASACSGHGFKFAPVVGEILADLVTEGRTRHPIGLFRLDRFPA